MTKLLLIATLILTSCFPMVLLADKQTENGEELKNDLKQVWPLVQTVKIEYELAMVQLEFCKTDNEREQFLTEFEAFVKDKYFKQVLSLKLRQGKLLLLLIHRELGKTPFDLLKEYRSVWRARFWQRFARIVGASLKEEYNPVLHYNIEREVNLLEK